MISSLPITYQDFSGNTVTTFVHHVLYKDMDSLKDKLDETIVSISHGDPDFTIDETKSDIKRLLAKKGDDSKHGAVAEFFAHLVLNELGFTQYCAFLNLEEGSLKKGFDGLYECSFDFWLVESKSAYTESDHKTKVNEALTDLKTKVEDTKQNDPWNNAVNHMKALRTVEPDETIYKKVLALSKEYKSGKGHTLSEFNVLPVSTLFVPPFQDEETLKTSIVGLLQQRAYKSIVVICVDNCLFDAFLAYLG